MANQVDVEGIRAQEMVLKALKNMGHDTTCGACMARAFTGDVIGTHTCRKAMPVTTDNGETLTVDHIIKALNDYREDFEGALDHLFFLQAVIATSLKDSGMPKKAYLQGCAKAWEGDDKSPTETIPRNTH
jgi:predicted P-loop ATPase